MTSELKTIPSTKMKKFLFFFIFRYHQTALIASVSINILLVLLLLGLMVRAIVKKIRTRTNEDEPIIRASAPPANDEPAIMNASSASSDSVQIGY